jgi:Mn-dependent DtxR family transcriptional regulator
MNEEAIGMKEKDEFRTFRGYSLAHQGELTPSMEDYLEMIFRLEARGRHVRVNEVAAALNVQPPSVSRAVRRLANDGFVKYQPYGLMELTDKGREVDETLLHRHQLLETFLDILGVTENLLEDTERIEHLLSDETLDQIAHFVTFAHQNPSWLESFHQHLHGATEESVHGNSAQQHESSPAQAEEQ